MSVLAVYLSDPGEHWS